MGSWCTVLILVCPCWVCDSECVPVYLLSWVLGFTLSWYISGPPPDLGHVSTPSHSLPVAVVPLPTGALLVFHVWVIRVCSVSLLGSIWWSQGTLALSGLWWEALCPWASGVRLFLPWYSKGSCGLRVIWMSVAPITFISPLSHGGQIFGSSHHLLSIHMEETYMHFHKQVY